MPIPSFIPLQYIGRHSPKPATSPRFSNLLGEESTKPAIPLAGFRYSGLTPFCRGNLPIGMLWEF